MSQELKRNCLYYQIGGLTIQVEADLPFQESTFVPKFKKFMVHQPGQERVVIRHHFGFPKITEEKVGPKVYEFPPWLIRWSGEKWYYFGYSPWEHKNLYLLAIVSPDYRQIDIFHRSEENFLRGGLPALTAFPTDQVLLARVFPSLQGAYFHGAGIIFERKGLIFLGQSGQGKSTITKFFMTYPQAKILCDDRIILRRQQSKWMIYGTWSHGEIPEVAPDAAPLTGLYFLQKASKNRLSSLKSPFEVFKRLVDLLVRPHPTPDWWEKVISLCQSLAHEVPAYELEFNLDGSVVELFK